MPKFLIAFVAIAALTAFSVPAARAEIEYPWCAYYGRYGTEATNCGFSTHQQCLATVSGIGGYCGRNPRYRGRAKH
jgi:hypothetical protein